MKTILLLPIFFFTISAFTQEKNVKISHYIFPEFVKSNVVSNTGGTNTLMTNYNALTEEMIFDNNGKKQAIGNLSVIDTIFIEGRIFIPYQDKFIELIYRNKYELFASYKCKLIEPGKPAPFGGTSQSSSTTVYTSLFTEGQCYELSLPFGYSTKPYTEYLLKKDGNISLFTTVRELSKLFESQSDIFKNYTKSHKVSRENQESIVELIKYMEQQ
jgi:hypothetical protein